MAATTRQMHQLQRTFNAAGEQIMFRRYAVVTRARDYLADFQFAALVWLPLR